MMNRRLRLSHVGIVCLVLSLLCATRVSGTQPGKEIGRLAKAYRAARTEFERRAVCLEAIDAGVIAAGRPVAVIDAIFGTTYAKKLPRGSELETGVVEFHPLPPPPSDYIQAAHVGWYFAFKFDSAGRLQDYELTNLHK